MELLPPEMLYHITTFLPLKDSISLNLVSKHTNQKFCISLINSHIPLFSVFIPWEKMVFDESKNLNIAPNNLINQVTSLYFPPFPSSHNIKNYKIDSDCKGERKMARTLLPRQEMPIDWSGWNHCPAS